MPYTTDFRTNRLRLVALIVCFADAQFLVIEIKCMILPPGVTGQLKGAHPGIAAAHILVVTDPATPLKGSG